MLQSKPEVKLLSANIQYTIITEKDFVSVLLFTILFAV